MNHFSFRRLPAVLLAVLLPALPGACRAPAPSPDTEPALDPAPAAEFPVPEAALPGETLLEFPADPLPSESGISDVPYSNLFILRWNPAVSSFTDPTFREGFARLRDDGDARTNWSLRDGADVRPGDWALFVRVGGADPATDGIAGLCRFLSTAYDGASWRGDGSTLQYADIDILLLNAPEQSGLFGGAELDAAFPSVDWHGGPSGVLVDPATAEALALHIADHLARAGTAAIPPDALALAPLGDDALRTLACTLLADLSPAFNRNLARLPAPVLPPDPAP